MAEAAGSAYTLSDAILQRLVAAGGTFNYDNYALDIRQDMLDNGFIDPSQNATGQYFIDWTKGTPYNANPAPGIQTQYQVANPSGSNLDQLRIFTRRFYPPVPASS